MAAINAMLTMIWPRPRMGFTLRGSSVRYGGRCYHRAPGRLLVPQERHAGDPGPTGETGELKECRGDVGEHAIREAASGHGPADQHERDGVQRVGRDRPPNPAGRLTRFPMVLG